MKLIFTLFTIALSAISLHAGDTTKVSSHSKVVIKTNPSAGVTEYPSKVKFPADSVSYRKVYMYLEFGCAPGLRCGEWDYGNHIYARKNGVRYELARYITPYGFYWNSSQNWKHGWYFDLTDFSDLLHDSLEIIYQHSGYEGNTDRGWTVTMDYFMVAGEAARIPMGLINMHRVNAPYGNDNSPFSSAVKPVSFVMPKGADAVDFKIIQTGHGMDKQENCSEFCSKKRTVTLDANTVSEKNVWREDCGLNSLFPQAGTWIYDRANWCPGAPVMADDIYLNINDTNTHTFSLNMEAYSNTAGGSANYDVTTYALFFKDNRKQVDAAIEDIISPSTHFDYLRLNPTCGAPIISVRNMGKDTLTRLEFEYGKLGGALQKIWVPCNIAPFTNQKVTLEAIYNWSGAGNNFVARITKVNDQVDQYPADNTMVSKITNSVVFPTKIIIVLKTNNAPSENYYTLKDAKGKVIRNKNNFAANTIYRDTVYLDNNVCYTFEMMDDGTAPSNNPLNRDGLDWWANTADGTGYIQIRNGNNNSMLKNFGADFGTKQMINFQTTYSMGIENQATHSIGLDIMPNPALKGVETMINIDVVNAEIYTLSIYDQTGREVQAYTSKALNAQFYLKGLASGIYTATLQQGVEISSKKFVVE